MLFKSKDELLSTVHTKSKKLSIVDIRNKKQRLLINAEMRTKIFILFFIRMHQNFCYADHQMKLVCRKTIITVL